MDKQKIVYSDNLKPEYFQQQTYISNCWSQYPVKTNLSCM